MLEGRQLADEILKSMESSGVKDMKFTLEADRSAFITYIELAFIKGYELACKNQFEMN